MKEPREADLAEIEKLYDAHEQLLKEATLNLYKRRSLTISQQRLVRDLEFLLSHPRCSEAVEYKVINVLAEAADEMMKTDLPA